MSKYLDQRVAKTNSAINIAFFELMNDVGFSKMTINRLIELAHINRSTFYAHYADKFDLLEKTENELLSGLISITANSPIDKIGGDEDDTALLDTHFLPIIKYLHENGKEFVLLISDKGDPNFVGKLRGTIKAIWEQKNILDRLSIPQSYAFAAITGMMSNMIIQWAKNDFRESPEEFAEIVLTIIKDIPKNIFT